MPPIPVTFEVSNPERLTDLNDEQQAKKFTMLVAFEVSKPERSASLRFLNSENISRQSSGDEITRFFMTTDVTASFFSDQPCSPSSPDVAPGSGSIVKQPLASIIHWQVPEDVQLTMGAPDSSDCKAMQSLSLELPSAASMGFSLLELSALAASPSAI